jgi:hypothetical protein
MTDEGGFIMRLSLFISLVLLLVFASWSMAADKIIMISAADPPGAEDQGLIDIIAALGFDVESHASSEAQPVDISGAAAVVIGEALSSSSVTDAYKDVPIPVVITESYILDDMQFAAGDATFNADADTTIVIADPAHPIAGGLTGEVQIATEAADVCSASELQGDVHVIATVKANGHPCLATYEEGAADMNGAAVPARRVFVFLFAGLIPNLTDEGRDLVGNSVLWALGMSPSAVTPEGAATATWGALKADYH